MYTQLSLRISLRVSSSKGRPIRPRSPRLIFICSRNISQSSSSNNLTFPVVVSHDLNNPITPTRSTSTPVTPPPDPSPKPFAIEHVEGREQHLSWSPDGKISKRWKDVPIGYTTEEGRNSGVRIPIISGLFSRTKSWLMTMFLPTNYPHSVHRSYKAYHLLQFAETTLGSLVSVLCNQALLTSVGVSAEGSIFAAVAIQWIIKDGAGEIAKLFFIRRFSPYFDSHPKTFNLLGEGAVALGSGLQIATLLVNPTPGNFVLCAASGNIFKLIGNAIWLTTHVKFVRYFSLRGNMGDVAAKAESQASVGQLVGYATGIGLLSFAHSPAYLYSIFFLAVPFHLFVTWYMLRLTTFELLTSPRLSWLASRYAQDRKEETGKRVLGLDEVDRLNVTGLFGEFFKQDQDRLVLFAPRLVDVVSSSSPDHRSRWEVCSDVFQNEKYLLYPPERHSRQPIAVFLDPTASKDDMLRSILHAARLRELLSHQSSGSDTDSNSANDLRSLLKASSSWTKDSFKDFKSQLASNDWRTDEVCFADHGRRVSWRSASSKPE